MELDVYQAQALRTALYPREHAVLYPLIGLANESGEALGKIKKVLRGDYDIEEIREPLLKEVGDCLWYIAVLLDDLGCSLNAVGEANIAKLASRQERGKLQGDGDDR